MDIKEFNNEIKKLINELSKSQGAILSNLNVETRINDSVIDGKHIVGYNIDLKFK